jgi:hypothetical protein
LKSIFIDEGLWKDSSKLKIGWTPVFQRDLKDLVSLIEKTTATKILSNRTAREKMGVDHSEELERLKTQKTEEPDELPEVPNLQGKVASSSSAQNSK